MTAYKMHCLPFYLKTSTSPSTFTSEKLVIRMGDFWKLHRGMAFFGFFLLSIFYFCVLRLHVAVNKIKNWPLKETT